MVVVCRTHYSGFLCVYSIWFSGFLDANVNKPREKFTTPLHLAALNGDMRIVKLLVESNARVNALNSDQATPLHKATAFNNYQAIEYLVKK